MNRNDHFSKSLLWGGNWCSASAKPPNKVTSSATRRACSTPNTPRARPAAPASPTEVTPAAPSCRATPVFASSSNTIYNGLPFTVYGLPIMFNVPCSMFKAAIKREESDARISYPERKQARNEVSMNKTCPTTYIMLPTFAVSDVRSKMEDVRGLMSDVRGKR